MKQKIVVTLLPLCTIIGILGLFQLIKSVQAISGNICDVPTVSYTNIQAAVDDATCDTINLTASYYTENIIVDRSMTIQGQGFLSTTIDGNDLDSVFIIQPGSFVTLSHMAIVNGQSGDPDGGPIGGPGGGVLNLGSTVTILESEIKDNYAWPWSGGGVYNVVTGTLNIISSTLSANIGVIGGAIYNNGLIQLRHSLVISNIAEAAGGIYNNGSMSIDHTNLINNRAGTEGGGIHNRGDLSLSDSTLRDNQVDDFGGGIYISTGVVTVTKSLIISNTSGYIGGGVSNRAFVTLENTLVGFNYADSGGGGIENAGVFIITASTLQSNTTSGFGGGVQNNSGLVNITNSTLSGNLSPLLGGGIYNLGDGSVIELVNSTLAENSAPASAGIHTVGNNSTVNFQNSIIALNQGSNNCGGNFNTAGYNVSDDASCDLNGVGDLVNVDPLLGPLQDNGGDTLTHALMPGSEAIDHIPDGVNGCGSKLIYDQRGSQRPSGDGCDIGAYEEYFPQTSWNLYLPAIIKMGNSRTD